MTDELPHDAYMAAVDRMLTVYGVRAATVETSSPDGRVLDGWVEFDPADVDSGSWPDGVVLGWDQYRGWTLIEQGGGRSVHPLDAEGVTTCAAPRQVAVGYVDAIRGEGGDTGPILHDAVRVGRAVPELRRRRLGGRHRLTRRTPPASATGDAHPGNRPTGGASAKAGRSPG
ncbi:hypothetical protein, partial [Kitasatospora purpeofusca]|uniref:hypothetical protein n=1 Tax=Kitasatospora purpeofusca TaxID=67352 RepID=UPI00369C1BC7